MDKDTPKSDAPRGGTERAGRDRPWIIRTYSGHSTAAESNRLYRGNLIKGQTGLSIAFDLPTQTGYDPDHEPPVARSGRWEFPLPTSATCGPCLRTFRSPP